MNFFKRTGRKIIELLYPEITILNNRNIVWSKIISYSEKCEFQQPVKLYEPYRIVNSAIGAYTYIHENSNISETSIGKFCSIGPNFICGWGIHPTDGISTSPMFYSTKKQNGISLCDKDKVQERKPIDIGHDVFIGANVTILDGVSIGTGAVIGAGAVVSKDIPPYAIAVGCPIQITRFRFSEQQREKLLKIKWWDRDLSELKEFDKLFFEIDQVISRFAKNPVE